MSTIRHEAERAQRDMQRLFNVFGASGSTGYADIDSLFDGHLVVSRHMTGKAQPDRLSADAETAVFRLVQEALTNTRKHAGEGAKATIDEFWSNDVLSITVSDNGRGAASAADGHKPDTDWLVCTNALSRWAAACRPAQGRMVALLWRLRFRSPLPPHSLAPMRRIRC